MRKNHYTEKQIQKLYKIPQASLRRCRYYFNNGGDKMQVTKTEKFVKAEDIKGVLDTTFKILEEPIEVQGTYGKKLECRIQMQNGSEKAFAKWSINNTNKDLLIDGVGSETSDWIGKELKVHVETINNKDSIILNKEQF